LFDFGLFSINAITPKPLSIGSQLASGILCLYYDNCEKPLPYQENTSYTYISKPVDFSTITAFSAENTSVDIYPNPVINEFTIQINEDKFNVGQDVFELTIFNLEGKVVSKTNNLVSGGTVNIANLPTGTYVGVLIRNNQVFQSLKFNKF
jgi:hypothetical protein